MFVWGVLAAALLAGGHHLAHAGQQPAGWTQPRTPWGDPDLTGRWPITEHSRFTSSTGLSGSA